MAKETRRVKGTGCLIKNPEKKTYTLRKQCGYSDNGKPKILVVTGKNESECIKKMAQKERDWLLQKDISSAISTNETVKELCERHLKNQIASQLLAPKSIDRRESTIKNQIASYSLGNKYTTAVLPRDIENHITRLIATDLSASSIVKALDVINAAFDWAMSRQELDSNPCLSVKKSLKKAIGIRAQKEADDMDVKVLNDIEYERFKKECLRKDSNGNYIYNGSLLLLFLLYTGMRTGELLALTRNDYNPSTGLLAVYESRSMAKNRDKESAVENNYKMTTKETKNGKARVIQLSSEAQNVLSQILLLYPVSKHDTIVPSSGKNIPNTANKLEYRANQIYKSLKFPSEISGLHILRRTFATRWYNKGARVADIAAYIGDLESTTQKYYIAKRKRQIINGESTVYVPLPQTKK